MKASQWRRMVENRCIFSARLNALSDWSGDHSAGGRRSPAGLVTAKLRCPVAVWVRATSRVPVTADRRCWQHTGVMTIEYSRRGQVHPVPNSTAPQISWWYSLGSSDLVYEYVTRSTGSASPVVTQAPTQWWADLVAVCQIGLDSISQLVNVTKDRICISSSNHSMMASQQTLNWWIWVQILPTTIQFIVSVKEFSRNWSQATEKS